MAGALAYAHAIWLTSPNQALALLMSFGIGKFAIAPMMWSDGWIPSGVIFSPANMAVSWQNWNLFSLIVMPLSMHSCR